MIELKVGGSTIVLLVYAYGDDAFSRSLLLRRLVIARVGYLSCIPHSRYE